MGVPVGHGRRDHELPPGARAPLAGGRRGRRRRGGVAARERRRARRRPRADRARRLLRRGHARRGLRRDAASCIPTASPASAAWCCCRAPTTCRPSTTRRCSARTSAIARAGRRRRRSRASSRSGLPVMLAVAEHDPPISHRQAAIAFTALYERERPRAAPRLRRRATTTSPRCSTSTRDDRLLGDQIAAFVQAHAPARERSGAPSGASAVALARRRARASPPRRPRARSSRRWSSPSVGVLLAALGALARDRLARAPQRLLRVGLAAAAL